MAWVHVHLRVQMRFTVSSDPKSRDHNAMYTEYRIQRTVGEEGV